MLEYAARVRVGAASLPAALDPEGPATSEHHEGELEPAVETTADVVGCPGCGAVDTLHGRRPTRVRNLPSAGRPVTLIWVKLLWRCRHQLCPVVRSTFADARPWARGGEAPPVM